MHPKIGKWVCLPCLEPLVITPVRKDNEIVASSGKKPIKEFGVRGNVWHYHAGANYGTKDKIAFKHSATFPESLVYDHIYTWSNKGDTIVDILNGSGTTTKMAKLMERKYIGVDISQEYCELAKERLKISTYAVEKNPNGNENLPPAPKPKEKKS